MTEESLIYTCPKCYAAARRQVWDFGEYIECCQCKAITYLRSNGSPLNSEESAPLHVIPNNDLKEHAASPDCWCKPSKEDDEPLYIHHSADGRELVEPNK